MARLPLVKGEREIRCEVMPTAIYMAERPLSGSDDMTVSNLEHSDRPTGAQAPGPFKYG